MVPQLSDVTLYLQESRSCHSQEVVKRAHYAEEHVRNVVAGSELLDLVESSIDPEHTQVSYWSCQHLNCNEIHT